MFFQSVAGKFFPVSRIRSVGPVEQYDYQGQSISARRVELDQNEATVVSDREFTSLMDRPVTTFPAEPGTFVLHMEHGQEEPPFQALVIGWGVSMGGDVHPITVDGINDGVDEAPPVLTPDGKVTQAYVRNWKSIGDFIEGRRGCA